MTPAELEAAARNRYNAVDDPQFNSTMVLDLIYQAQMEMANECFVIEDTFQTTSTAGTREYAYPTNAIAIRRVEYNGKKLEPVSLEADPKSSTTAPQGTPGEYAIWENTLYLFPTPAVTSDVIKVFAYTAPQELSSSSTTLDVPVRYHLAIIDYILEAFAAKDSNPQMATYFRGKWEKSLGNIKRSQAKGKRGDQYAVVRDVSSDPYYPGRVL
jgi:hypothetical protein